MSKINQVIYVSATPGPYEREHSAQIVEQLIRPTGLVDPQVVVKPSAGQIDDLLSQIKMRTERNERVLVVTLTKRMAESLTEYLQDMGVRVRYMHHETETMDRIETLRDLRRGEFDVLVGINLLREGLDLPEVSLIAVLDADKEGFLRNETSLIQIIGRAARNANGMVIMYADSVTPSMENAIKETERRRNIQMEYNRVHGIVPKTIIKPIQNISLISESFAEDESTAAADKPVSGMEADKLIERLTQQMKQASKQLDFETAAKLRDRIREIKKQRG